MPSLSTTAVTPSPAELIWVAASCSDVPSAMVIGLSAVPWTVSCSVPPAMKLSGGTALLRHFAYCASPVT